MSRDLDEVRNEPGVHMKERGPAGEEGILEHSFLAGRGWVTGGN